MNEYIEKGALYDALWDAKEEKSVKSLKDVFDFLDKFPVEDVQAVKWISISEKHPTKTGSFLFSFGGELTIAFYKAEIKEIEMPSGLTLSVDEAKRCAVSVHWMPLPEPPKEGVHQ